MQRSIKKPKKKFHTISYPKFTLKFKIGKKWVNILHTKKPLRILYRIKGFGADFKWEKAYLRFQYDRKFHNDGYYYNMKDLLYSYRLFSELLEEFEITYK